MSRSEVLVELFDAYGNDAQAALEAMANVDPLTWSTFVEEAAARQYRSEYAAWVRRQTKELSIANSAPRLFSVDEVREVTLRERIVIRQDGERREHALMALAGAHGAAIIRTACQRDERGARTTLGRTAALKKLAAELERRSEAEGRPVSVAEILGEAA